MARIQTKIEMGSIGRKRSTEKYCIIALDCFTNFREQKRIVYAQHGGTMHTDLFECYFSEVLFKELLLKSTEHFLITILKLVQEYRFLLFQNRNVNLHLHLTCSQFMNNWIKLKACRVNLSTRRKCSYTIENRMLHIFSPFSHLL